MKKIILLLILALCINHETYAHEAGGCEHEEHEGIPAKDTDCNFGADCGGPNNYCETRIYRGCSCQNRGQGNKFIQNCATSSESFSLNTPMNFNFISSNDDQNIIYFHNDDLIQCGDSIALSNIQGTFTIQFSQGVQPDSYNLDFLDMTIVENSYNLCGNITGTNNISIISSNSGTINSTSGFFSGSLNVVLDNSIENQTISIDYDGIYDFLNNKITIHFYYKVNLPIASIPTLSQWGLIILSLLILIIGILSIRQEQKTLSTSQIE